MTKYFFISLLLFHLFGCSSNHKINKHVDSETDNTNILNSNFTDDSRSHLELIPLRIGNTWKYTSNNGNTGYAKVTGTKTILGKTWHSYYEIDKSDIYYLRNNKHGQFEHYYAENSNYVDLVLQVPNLQTLIYRQFDIKTKATPNIEITVPAGTFKTIKYEFSLDDPENYSVSWIAPNIGVIKSKLGNEVYELVNYTLTNAAVHNKAVKRDK